VSSLGFEDSWFRVQGLTFRVSCFEFQVEDYSCSDQRRGSRFQNSSYKVQGLRFRV
jgi:hypothetical protein